MGYSERKHIGGTITSFWPDDTEDEFYIASSASFSEIIQKARDHFGEDIDISNLIISPEHIHTDCLYYDRHDPSDWTNFLCISKVD